MLCQKIHRKAKPITPTPTASVNGRSGAGTGGSVNAALTRSGLSRNAYDSRVRSGYAQRHPEETGGEWGAINRGLNLGAVMLPAGERELAALKERYDAAPTEENRLAYNACYDRYEQDYSDYGSAVEQYRRYTSAEGIKARSDALTAEIEELRQRQKLLENQQYAYYRGWRPNPADGSGVQGIQDDLDEVKRSIQRKEQAYNQLARQYYAAENEEKLWELGRDGALTGQYDSANALREDMEKILAVAADATNRTGGPEIEEYKAYLGEKYGITQKDIDNYAIGGAGFLPGGTREGYGNLWRLYEELEARQGEAAGALSAGGYDYERMTGYLQRQEAAGEEERRRGRAAEDARAHPVLASAASVLMGPAQGLEYLKVLGANLTGASDPSNLEKYVPLSAADMPLTGLVQTYRGTVSREIEENTDWELFGQNVASFLYNTGMSMADSLLGRGPGKQAWKESAKWLVLLQYPLCCSSL